MNIATGNGNKELQQPTTKTYDEIEAEMKLWRMGAVGFPDDYIKYHWTLASEALDALRKQGFTIYQYFMGNDGWMDGMRKMFVIAQEPKHGRLVKLEWSDSHAKGSWFEVLPNNCGAIRYEYPPKPAAELPAELANIKF